MQSCGGILPHATAYNRAGAPAAMARIARALEAEDAAKGLFDLAAALGAKQSLAEIGLRESDLERAADVAVESPYPNPTPLTRASIRALLEMLSTAADQRCVGVRLTKKGRSYEPICQHGPQWPSMHQLPAAFFLYVWFTLPDLQTVAPTWLPVSVPGQAAGFADGQDGGGGVDGGAVCDTAPVAPMPAETINTAK